MRMHRRILNINKCQNTFSFVLYHAYQLFVIISISRVGRVYIENLLFRCLQQTPEVTNRDLMSSGNLLLSVIFFNILFGVL